MQGISVSLQNSDNARLGQLVNATDPIKAIKHLNKLHWFRESHIKLGEWQLSFNPEFHSNKLVRIYKSDKFVIQGLKSVSTP